MTGNHRDIYNLEKDYLVIRGKKMRPTKYFDSLYKQINPQRLENIKARRIANREELTITELRAHEKRTRARIINKTQV